MVARQARSELTRRKIIDAAVDLFDEVGYSNAGLGDIVERAGMTKGALYHHFSSKEALAVAVISEGSDILVKAFQSVCRSSAPALECIIHGVLVVVDVGNSDKLARMSALLLRVFAKFSEVSTRNYSVWLAEMEAQVRRAQVEGDLRADINARQAAEFMVGSILGTELITNALPGGENLVDRICRVWEFILPAVASEQSLPYLREFLARESLRRHRQSATT